MIERTPQGADALAHYRHPEDHHAFVASGRTHPGSDGRLVQECGVDGCGAPPNAGRHRDPKALIRRASARNLHPFVLGGPERRTKAGAVIRECGDPSCRKAQNSPTHWTPDRARLAPGRKGAGRPQSPPQGAPRGRTIAPAEYVSLALAVDRILALPPEVVGWRLRMRLADVRTLLDVPAYPTLALPAVPEATPDPDPVEAETTAQVEASLGPRLAQYAPVVHGDAQVAGILRGIRNDRHRTLVRRAQAAGWEIAMTGSGHVSLSKGSQRLILSTTAGDGRRGHNWGNVRAQAKRAGLDVTGL